jgi:ribosomal protein S18 acetylase RimI-like enzyme
MARYEVRALESGDFDAIMELEEGVFGAGGESTLGPYYVRLCTEFFGDTCFVAFVDGRPIGYLLSFLRGREVYCTTLAVRPEYQGTRATLLLLRAFLRRILGEVEACWFTVSEENQAARALHAVLGAREVEVRRGFYGAGDDRIMSRIDAESFARMRPRLERLGLLERGDRAAPVSGSQRIAEVA